MKRPEQQKKLPTKEIRGFGSKDQVQDMGATIFGQQRDGFFSGTNHP